MRRNNWGMFVTLVASVGLFAVGCPSAGGGGTRDSGGGGTDTGGGGTDAGGCRTGETMCGAACANTMRDDANCGMCSHACPTGEHCTAGACMGCATGTTLCGTACAATATDPLNCGMCAHACATGETCSAGMCRAACPAPRMICTMGTGMGMTSSCVDVTTDPLNCGTCAHACGAGRTCTGGTCVCTGTATDCSGTCVDTAVDNANCGTCAHACTGGQTCAARACACPSGQMSCSGACVNTSSSNANCGSCGHACGAGESCGSGTCTSMCAAMPGTVYCGTAAGCINPVTSATNCGMCGHACAASESCALGSCRPLNDLRTGAIAIALGTAEVTLTGSTTNATPSSAAEPSTNTTTGGFGCGTITSNNVWYSFTLTQAELVYADTLAAAPNYDTLIYFADSTGTPLTSTATVRACNDDSCATRQSRIGMQLGGGTYYIVVAGFSGNAGDFTLHFQHLPMVFGTTYSYVYQELTGNGATTDTVVTGTAHHPVCGGTAGEDAYWFQSCGTAMSLLSMCASDGGSWQRLNGATSAYDPAIGVVTGTTGTDFMCNDDAPVPCAASYLGLAGDGSNYGSRLNVMFPRGINILVVENRNAMTGMNYTIGYQIQ